jgi:hypothetical protein
LEFGSAEFHWATTDEGKEVLRKLRANAPGCKELNLYESARLFRFVYAARASFLCRLETTMRAEKLALDDVRALADALANNTTLTTLNLGSTCLGDDTYGRNG